MTEKQAARRGVAADEAPSPVPGVTRPVFLLATVSFLTDLSSEMVYPFIPLFLTSSLGAPVAAVGLIEGFAEGTASLVRIGSGWLSDRTRSRKPLVVAGYAVSAVAKPLLAAAQAWPTAWVRGSWTGQARGYARPHATRCWRT